MKIDSPKQMLQLGQKLAKEKKKIIFLYGELGAGKTLFTKGFAQGLGVDPNIVQSPTYTYVNIYDNKLLHLDLYRIDKQYEIIEKGIKEEIVNYDYIIIERPRFEHILELEDITKVHIKKTGENTREVSVE